MPEKSFEKIIPSTPDTKPISEGLEKREKIENQQEKSDKEEEKIKVDIQNTAQSSPSAMVDNFQEERAKMIDSILSEGLDDVFLKLDAKHQKEFKEKGEETVQKINVLLDNTKVKVRKIISLIKEWLKIIPGVNKFFLEQESKIKADKIIEMKNKF